jgi:hypothetical protein
LLIGCTILLVTAFLTCGECGRYCVSNESSIQVITQLDVAAINANDSSIAHDDDNNNDDITPLHHIKKSLDDYHTAQHTSVTATRVGGGGSNNTSNNTQTLTSPNRPPPKTPKRHSPSPKPPATVITCRYTHIYMCCLLYVLLSLKSSMIISKNNS